MEQKAANTEMNTKSEHGTLATYIAGFILSVLLTIVAYTLVVNKVLTGRVLITAILVLAVVQFFVQLVFFLHLGRESRPRWNLTVFGFMLLVLLILLLGSLWIMNSLNYFMRESPQQQDKAIIEDEGYNY